MVTGLRESQRRARDRTGRASGGRESAASPDPGSDAGGAQGRRRRAGHRERRDGYPNRSQAPATSRSPVLSTSSALETRNCSTSWTSSRRVSAVTKPASTGCFPPCFSPTSAAQRRGQQRSVIVSGAAPADVITPSFGRRRLLPRRRGGYGRRWVLRNLRRPGASDLLRPRHRGGRPPSWHRDSGRRAHGRVRDDRRKGGRHGRRHRRPSRSAGETVRGADLPDRQRPCGGLGTRAPRPRRSRTQGHPRPLATLRRNTTPPPEHEQPTNLHPCPTSSIPYNSRCTRRATSCSSTSRSTRTPFRSRRDSRATSGRSAISAPATSRSASRLMPISSVQSICSSAAMTRANRAARRLSGPAGARAESLEGVAHEFGAVGQECVEVLQGEIVVFDAV